MQSPAAPAAVLQLLQRLQQDGHQAALVGGCVRDLLRGAPVRDWDIATSARPERSLALFPRAVPIGLRHGTIMAPCAAGPVDVTPFRGANLAEDLARRDFTINAMAWDPLRNAWHDPHGGRADLAAQTLRAAGRAEERLAEDPLRALRAARLLAALHLRIAPALRDALPGAAGALLQVAPERIRSELERLLLTAQAGRGMALLRQSGLEAALLPGVRADAAGLVALLPADLELRLAAWLVAGFLLAYLAKRLLTGAEDLSGWGRAALLNLWIHEALVGTMLICGGAALLFARRMAGTRRVTGNAQDAAAPPALLRRHRIAGRIACGAAVLGLLTACGILAGMIARAH